MAGLAFFIDGEPMDYLPIFYRVKQRPCLVVGGGAVAARKTSLLLKAGANVKVISPQLHTELERLVEANKITHEAREFTEKDLDGCVLVFAATDQRDVNEQISSLANERNLPVNVADNTELCNFIMPSIIDRSPVQSAVSSSGSSSVLARMTSGSRSSTASTEISGARPSRSLKMLMPPHSSIRSLRKCWPLIV